MFLANGGEPFVPADGMLLRGNIAQAAPVNSAAPVVTGTAGVGNTLSTTNGTWTGTVTSYSRQWYSNTAASTVGGTPLAGDFDPTLYEDETLAGKYLYCGVIAHNWGKASAEKFSNVVGPVAAASGLTAPTLTLTSATGATPEWNSAFGSDIFAGYFVQIEASADGITNGDGTYTTPIRSVTHQLTAADVADGNIPHAELVADGWSDLTGTWHLHEWVFREDGVKSGISNELTGTVSAFIAEFASTSGFDKSTNLTLSNGNLTGVVTINDNSLHGARVQPAPGTGKWHIELHIDSLANASSGESGNIAFGCIGEVQDFTTHLSAIPGNSTAQGASCILRWDNIHALIYANGGLAHTVTLTGSVAPVVGDIIGLEFDDTANTVSFYFKPAATGVVQTLSTDTLTTNIPATWHAYAAGYRSGPPADGFTMNSGQSAFAITATTGYVGW